MAAGKLHVRPRDQVYGFSTPLQVFNDTKSERVRADARFCFSSRDPPHTPTPISEVLAAGRKGKQTQQATVVELFIRPQPSTQSSAPTHGLTRKHQSPAHIKNTQMEVCDVVSFQKIKKSHALSRLATRWQIKQSD